MRAIISPRKLKNVFRRSSHKGAMNHRSAQRLAPRRDGPHAVNAGGSPCPLTWAHPTVCRGWRCAQGEQRGAGSPSGEPRGLSSLPWLCPLCAPGGTGPDPQPPPPGAGQDPQPPPPGAGRDPQPPPPGARRDPQPPPPGARARPSATSTRGQGQTLSHHSRGRAAHPQPPPAPRGQAHPQPPPPPGFSSGDA